MTNLLVKNSDSLADDYENLITAITLSEQTLNIFIAICNDLSLQNELIEQSKKDLADEGIHVYIADLGTARERPWYVILHIRDQELFKRPAMVHAIVNSQENLSESSQVSLLESLQASREAFNEFAIPIVFWLPETMVKSLITLAPDFWSWRKEVFYFGETNINSNHQLFNFNLSLNSQDIPSDVPQGTPYFVGRLEDLETLHQALQEQKNSNIVTICVIRGMGGIGKSELAIQYTLSPQYNRFYTACYWLSLRQGNLAELVLAKTLTFPYLTIPEELVKQGTIDQQVAWCWQNWYPTEGEILIIIDDVQSLEDIPEKWLPKQSRFKVIITTRQRYLSPHFTELSLGLLSENESLEFLEKIVDKKGTKHIDNELETAKKICQWLGYLPLGLELAGIYLANEKKLSLGEFLQHLTREDESLSEEMVRGITAEREIIATFNLSWQKLTGLSTQLAMLLSRFALAEIPWQMLVEPTVKRLGWESKSVKIGLRQLLNLSLIQNKNNDAIIIHPLLREYFRYQSEKVGENFIHQLQQAICISCLEVAKSIPQTPVIDDIKRVELAIPHLQYLSETMLDDIPNPEDNLFWVFTGIARYYEGQGKYQLAEVPYERCVQEVESRLGKENEYYPSSLNNLALLYKSQGRYSEAESLYLRALSIREQQSGENHPNTATSLNNLAALYKSQGKLDNAEPLYLRALSIREQQSGKNHPDTALSLNNLAGLYESQGRYSKAEPLYLRALSICEQQSGKNHPDTALSLNNLAGLYESQGRYSEAEPLYVRAINILQNTLGNDNPNTQTVMNNYQIMLSQRQPVKRSFLCRLLTTLGVIVGIILKPFYLIWLGLRWLKNRL
jgi:tetratricopeptide (TPR) repeat protein